MLTGAVILAGGQARRMSGVDKVMALVDGVPILQRVIDAVHAAGVEVPVVVGDPREDISGAIWVQEQPAGAGPGAAIATGLAMTDTALVAVLAGDLPFLTSEVLAQLVDNAGSVGAVAVDAEGHEQWLLGVHRQLVGVPDVSSARGILDRPGLTRVSVAERSMWDCDTPEDLQRAQGELL